MGPDRVGGVEAGGSGGGVEAGDRADDEGDTDAAGEGLGWDGHGPVLGVGVGPGGEGADDHTGDAAERREGDRFDDELAADVASGGSERAAQSDLGASFDDGDDHDVRDADSTDE